MKPFHIIGQPGSGKTTLVADLIGEMVQQDIRVGSMKHSAHLHELDKPGKDSYIHRKAGASIASMLNREMAAIYLPQTEEITPEALLTTYYSQMDVVLIEGWISGPHDKIEIWRNVGGKQPVFPDIEMVRAIVSDIPLPWEIKQQASERDLICFNRNDIKGLAGWIVAQSLLQ